MELEPGDQMPVIQAEFSVITSSRGDFSRLFLRFQTSQSQRFACVSDGRIQVLLLKNPLSNNKPDGRVIL